MLFLDTCIYSVYISRWGILFKSTLLLAPCLPYHLSSICAQIATETLLYSNLLLIPPLLKKSKISSLTTLTAVFLEQKAAILGRKCNISHRFLYTHHILSHIFSTYYDL